jgi:hypothetical protein
MALDSMRMSALRETMYALYSCARAGSQRLED